ncbi:MAG TPA: hypothetical protein DDY59_01945 [Lachnospiraceae bacterium]|nr:hypothetical protein [Lachnospiraceae bacterium]HCR41530.1 hypothetical protein [Lachnospiraceae bacterium]
MHQGSCDGENAKLYDIRVTPDDLGKTPQKLVQYSLLHWQKNSMGLVGLPGGMSNQQELVEKLRDFYAALAGWEQRVLFFMKRTKIEFP